MGYYLRLSKITLDDYKDMLINGRLIPSMKILRENIDSVFRSLASMGINTMEELYIQLKTKKKAEDFAKQVGIDKEYVIVLRRSVSSFIPPLRKLSDYPCVDENMEKRFAFLNLKTSKDLYEYFVDTPFEEAIKELELDIKGLTYLKRLMDVTRLRYVSAIIATVLVESGYDSVKKIACAEQMSLHETFHNTNQELQLYKGKLGKNDVLFLIEDAKLYTSLDIEKA